VKEPEVYRQFFDIPQTYQRDSVPIAELYAQVTYLFDSVPELAEDFKQFLPEYAALAKTQAANRAAADQATVPGQFPSSP
jgi:paired amphipathic helix protein Sin3a